MVSSTTEQVPPGKMTATLLATSIMAGAGGLLFGYEIGVGGSAIAMDHFKQKFFHSLWEKTQPNPNADASPPTKMNYCNYDDQSYQVIVSSLFIVGAFVSLLAPALIRLVGRKWTMWIASVFFLCGTAMLTFADNLTTIVFGRIFWGICMGFLNASVPLYLSEIAPWNFRGQLNILFQLSTTIGIWAIVLICWALEDKDMYNKPEHDWRIAWGCSVCPGGLMFLGTLFLPDTPQSLLEHGKMEDARRVLQRVRGQDANVDVEFKIMVADRERAAQNSMTFFQQLKMVTSNKIYLPGLVICLCMAFLQQFTGINANEFYATQLFGMLGQSEFRQQMILQAVNCGSTFVAIALVDRLGRKFLLIEGSIQMICAYIAMAVLIGTDKAVVEKPAGNATVFFMCLFQSGFAWSWGPLGWLVPSEIMPVEMRAVGTSLATFSNFIFTAVVGQFLLTMLCHMEYGLYVWWIFFCLSNLVFTIVLIPETKGLKLEEVTAALASHPVWRHCYESQKLGSPSPMAQEKDNYVEMNTVHVQKLSP